MKRSSLGMAAAREKVTITIRYLRANSAFRWCSALTLRMETRYKHSRFWGDDSVHLEQTQHAKLLFQTLSTIYLLWTQGRMISTGT